MLYSQHGLIAVARAMMRVRRRTKQVATALPLADAYPAALGGRKPLFEHWLGSDPAEPSWSGLDLRGAPGSAPASLITGWDDVQLDPTLERYRRLRDADIDVKLTVGPWTHTSIFDKGWPVVFPATLRELRTRLAGEPADPTEAPVRVYVGGSGQWLDLPEWPPPDTCHRPWHLDADGSLRDRPPTRTGSSPFRYDPADPTPSLGGQTLANPAGSVDNSALEARADVLTFTSAPLAEALEVLGPVSLSVRLRASSPNHDVFARLCDVDPGGRSRNVCDGLIRRRPDGDTGEAVLTVSLSSTAHRFDAGHRIRLQVSGGAHPRYARNTGTGEPAATACRLAPVDIEVVHRPESPSTLTLPTADRR
jgi:putative CocE/NonD family hydrolase